MRMPMPKKAASSSVTPFEWRDRILELRHVAPRELADHPLQHKHHPETQRAVMEGVLKEVGIADVLRAYVSPSTGQLTLVDGHMRKNLGTQPWPIIILDVTDEEAAYLLATYDEIASLAHRDREKLDTLLRQVQSGDSAVQQLLSDVAQNAGLYQDAPSPTEAEAPEDFPSYDETIETEYCCPKCGYEWSGKPK